MSSSWIGTATTSITAASVRQDARTTFRVASSVSPRFSGRICAPTYPAGGSAGRAGVLALDADPPRAGRRRGWRRPGRDGLTHGDDRPGVLERHELGTVLAADRLDLGDHLGLELLRAALERVEAPARA